MYSLTSFVRKVRSIAADAPSYETRGLSRSKLDCVGLPMLAMIELGHGEYPMHSSNYFYRYEVEDTSEISGEDDVYLGELLFKTRGENESGYSLHERYVTGRYNVGDYLDAYHVGVVTGVDPLEITECTDTGEPSGIKITGSLGNAARSGWDCGGRIVGVDYNNYTQEEDDSMVYEGGVKATVNTGKAGTKTWNLRSAPDDTEDNVIAKVPFGTAVTVYETTDDWGQVAYGDVRGYIKQAAFTVSADADSDADATDDAEDSTDGGTVIALTAAEVAAIKSVAARL